MKTTTARAKIFAALVVPALIAAACKGEQNDDAKEGKGPGLDIGGNITLTAGQRKELTATMRDETGAPSDVTNDAQTVWSVANPSIANVVRGVVTALTAGSTTVQATFAGTHSPVRTVTVKAAPTEEPVEAEEPETPE